MATLRSLYYQNTGDIFVSEIFPYECPHASLRFETRTKKLFVTNRAQTSIGKNLERSLLVGEEAELENGQRICLGPFWSDSERRERMPFAFEVCIEDQWENPPDCVTCGICHGVLHVPLALQCGHIFCRNCITKWAQAQVASRARPKCPT